MYTKYLFNITKKKKKLNHLPYIIYIQVYRKIRKKTSESSVYKK